MNASLRFLKALADPTRLRLLRLLLDKPLCVCELTFALKMEQSRVSHQLQILRAAGMVEDRRDGRWIIYQIPTAVRGRLVPLYQGAIEDDLESFRIFRRDQAELEIGLKEDVRGARCATDRRPGRRRARPGKTVNKE